MTTVLALETASDVCSVALGDGRNILSESFIAPRRHNELLLVTIDKLLVASETRRSALDFVSFSCGPGSFTGVRLGASVAQGIAMAMGIDVIPIPTSDAMASLVMRSNPELEEFAVRRKSRRGWAYFARYGVEGDSVTCLEEDRLISEEEAECIANAFSDASVILNAEEVLRLALLRMDERVPPELALPLLVEGDTPYAAPANPNQNLDA